MTNEPNITALQEKLESERVLLVNELSTMGKRLSENSDDWVISPVEKSDPEPDENDAADHVEDLEEKIAAESELEVRYKEVVTALAKMKNGTYGICEIGGEKIEADRLEANPAAKTCKKHL